MLNPGKGVEMQNPSVTNSLNVWVGLLSGILLRWCVSMGPYSGATAPPMYGDYEAQRHWQEITLNTPVLEWYKNTTDNDLLYWGLDYPPLTAYHSWVCGFVAKKIDPTWVALRDSRGIESYYHKLFMRYTVLAADALILLPALYYVFKKQIMAGKTQAFLCTLLYPGLILVDYGHFQYNNVSLGLYIWAVYYLQKESDLIGAIFFALALNYKQMELFHALPFFCYLLGKALKDGFCYGTLKVVSLGVVVLGTFALCWLPFLSSTESLLAVWTRIFPVNRGLYEDKVANVWCAISPVLKLKQFLAPSQAFKVCALATLVASLPSAIHLLVRPSFKVFRLSCVVVSLAFYLFSFQVHEKSILIPALSACLVYNDAPFLMTWFLYVSVFSLSPLLCKEGLFLQYMSVKTIFVVVMLFNNGLKPSANLRRAFNKLTLNTMPSKFSQVTVFCCVSSAIIMEVLSVLQLAVNPPARFPDLWPTVISMFSCLHFVMCFVVFGCIQYHQGKLLNQKTKTG